MFRLAWVLLLLSASYQLVVQAVDMPSIRSYEAEPTSCVDGCSKRTLFNIIWGCVSTTIICTWAAIHPNIPPREGPVKRILRKLELMFWAVVAPEILPAWAFNQWLAAMTVRDLYNGKVYGQENCGIWEILKRWLRKDHKRAIWKTLKRIFSFYEVQEAPSFAWTTRHGHFLIMGGFHLVEPVEENSTSAEAASGIQQVASDAANVVSTSILSTEGIQTDTEKGCTPGNEGELKEGRVTILTLEMLRELLEIDPKFRIQITNEEIADRSKGDALAKMILILQSSWFICQCIARHVQGLGLTPLELTTLALASLNGITFMLWWDKPLGVEAPVRVHMSRTLSDAERAIEGVLSHFDFDTRLQRTFSARARFTSKFSFNFRKGWSEGSTVKRCLIVTLLPLQIALRPISIFTLGFFYTISDIFGTSASFSADATHVPTFYVPRHQYPKYWHSSLLVVFGTIFGGIHCAGWNLPFPTYPEQKLWRIASVGVAILPIAAIPTSPINVAIVIGVNIVISMPIVVGVAIVVGVPIIIGVVIVMAVLICMAVAYVVGKVLIFIFHLIFRLIFRRPTTDRERPPLLFDQPINPIDPKEVTTLPVTDPIDSMPTMPDHHPDPIDSMPTLPAHHPDPIDSMEDNVTTPTWRTRLLSVVNQMKKESLFFYTMLAYGTARLVLLGLAVALLRHQPPSAFTTVDWTKFYPHVF